MIRRGRGPRVGTCGRSRLIAVAVFSFVSAHLIVHPVSTARAAGTMCGTSVTNLQELNAAIAAFIEHPSCDLIELDGDINIQRVDPALEPISVIAIDPIDVPTAMTKDLTIDGKGFTLTGASNVSGFVIYLDSPGGSNTLTIRNLGMFGFGGSGALSVVSGTTVIERSLFTNNTFEMASRIPGMDDASAGAINAIGRLVVTDSQFDGNTGSYAGAVYSSPNLVPQLVPTGADSPPLEVLGSTFAGNNATAGGGAIYALQSLTMSSTTISGNSGGSAGALNVGGSVSLDFCTIVDNTGSPLGGGVSATSGIAISNSIVYQNTPKDAYGYVNISITSSLVTSQQSVESTSTAATLPTSNIIAEDPLLPPLGNYGGFALPGGSIIRTRPPRIGSPAIDTIEMITVGSGDGLTDQRGDGFPRFVGGLADMGAVEYWPDDVPDPLTDPTNSIPNLENFPWLLNLDRWTHLPDTK